MSVAIGKIRVAIGEQPGKPTIPLTVVQFPVVVFLTNEAGAILTNEAGVMLEKG